MHSCFEWYPGGGFPARRSMVCCHLKLDEFLPCCVHDGTLYFFFLVVGLLLTAGVIFDLQQIIQAMKCLGIRHFGSLTGSSLRGNTSIYFKPWRPVLHFHYQVNGELLSQVPLYLFATLHCRSHLAAILHVLLGVTRWGIVWAFMYLQTGLHFSQWQSKSM